MWNWLKNKWFYLTNLGVDDQMSISLEKKIILSNQLSLIFFVAFSAMNIVSMIFESFSSLMWLSFLSILTLWSVPILNSRGAYTLSSFLISVLTPFFTFIFSTGIGDKLIPVNIFFMPRLFLVALLTIPFVVIDKSKIILLIISVAFTLFLLFFTDYYLHYQGLVFSADTIDFDSYSRVNYYIFFAAFIIIFSMSFLTHINVKYEDKILYLLAELRQSNEELEQQKMQIQQAFTTIEVKNRKITESIEYAGKLQNTFLPTYSDFHDKLGNAFVFYQPRDIVSGDFYWVHETPENRIFIAADCTGHGVPGAILSILAITLINELVVAKKNEQPDILLNKLREQVKIALNQHDFNSFRKDGMDISVCNINKQTLEMQFAGAYNSAYIFRKQELTELKADRQPVGVYIKEQKFTLHNFQLQKDDTIYLFSDGFISQFGGDKNEKFGFVRFKKMLSDLSVCSMRQHEPQMEAIFNHWQKKQSQLDDILVMGYRV
jgi:serine phosphatase RsbU (regulator of sigma subunit)